MKVARRPLTNAKVARIPASGIRRFFDLIAGVEGAISLGCVVAAATGQIYLGIPCVVGGAATSAALRYWASRE